MYGGSNGGNNSQGASALPRESEIPDGAPRILRIWPVR